MGSQVVLYGSTARQRTDTAQAKATCELSPDVAESFETTCCPAVGHVDPCVEDVSLTMCIDWCADICMGMCANMWVVMAHRPVA